jgi:hypothetical protein
MDRSGAPTLAREARDVLEGICASITNRTQLKYYGSFYHSSRGLYFGIPKQRRGDYEEFVKEALRSASRWSVEEDTSSADIEVQES